MGKTGRLFIYLAFVILFAPVVDAVSCGDYLTSDTNLTADLNCSGVGLDLNTDDIVLDCQNHVISGINNTGFWGIGVDSNHNVTIKNCVINNYWRGIFLYSASNSNLVNNNVSDSPWGIYLEQSDNNNLTSNTANNNSAGISLKSSDNNKLISNNASNNYNDDGIYLLSSSNNTLIGNTASNNDDYGIQLDGFSNNNTLLDNTVNHNDAGGIDLRLSSSNTLTSNIINNNSWYGIYLESSNNNALNNNTVSNSGDRGIFLYNSSNNNLSFNTANNTWGTGIDVFSWSSYNTLVSNKVYNNILGIGVGGPINHDNVLINNTVCDNSYRDISYISGFNHSGDNVCTTLDYNGSGDITCLWDCSGNPNCGVTLTDDLILGKNLNCNGLGLSIGANNVTLDCDGHSLIGNGTDSGVSVINKKNVTIQNCVITNFSYGIQLRESENNYLSENTINENFRGIFIYLSNNNTLSGNIVDNNAQRGIHITELSYYNRVYNNTASNNGGDGVYISSASNNTFINNIAEYNGEHGFYHMGIIGIDIGNTLYNNRFCFNINQDVYDIGTTTGDNNTCNIVQNYNDGSVISGCVYKCHRYDLVTGWNLISLPLTI
jgi:parallel beta-helix repeat protein